jgi:hypothetical protein
MRKELMMSYSSQEKKGKYPARRGIYIRYLLLPFSNQYKITTRDAKEQRKHYISLG